ncbi:hypothetical protein IE4872_CH00025 [Rhizobium gallicum]|uniref:Uncharacterized protein n=1 Tax=Rhizobium gallicum TaxID=56730 RepID=A0A1L5NCT7_9HYPH|nr:hypothetical protein IE4872_CH00025 [Rhizobium gallicum]
MAHGKHGRVVHQGEFGLADLPLPRPPGRHQYANAAAAIRAVKAAGFVVTEAMMEKAMNFVEWPGRLIAHAPAGAEIWVDGGPVGEALDTIEEILDPQVLAPES